MAADLLIFDMDGVLVDSELLANTVFAAHLRPYGLSWSPEETMAKLSGLALPDCVARLEAVHGVVVAPDFIETMQAETFVRLRADLRPIDHVHVALSALPQPRCLASSSEPAKIDLSLYVTGLESFFPPSRRFSATMVPRGKPHPDLFLHAAAQCGVAPGRCIVIEDSPYGAAAATAAGMRVLGFARGRSDGGEALTRAGAVVYTDMRSLPAMVASVGAML